MVDAPARNAIASASIPRLSATRDQEIANSAWSIATLKVEHFPCMAALAASSLPIINEVEPRHFSMTAWSVSVWEF